MKCGYCFYSDVTDIRAVKNRGIMTENTLEMLVKKALSAAEKYCIFGFQGGEPTLAGLDFFKKLIELEKKYNVNNVQISHALQTNGLLIDNEWAEFFHINKFLIGLSIDAAKQIHDFYRTDIHGNGTHKRCMAAAQIFLKNNVEFNILSVLTGQYAKHPVKAYNFYKQNNFRYIQFIPCLDGLNEQHGVNIFSLDVKTYSKFLCQIFDLWYTDLINGDYYSIRIFDNYIQMLAGKPAENCAMNGVCSAIAVVEADGNVYPCDFYAVDEYLLGNINTNGFEEMLTGEKADAFIAPSRHINQACLKCDFHFICRGGCRRDREPVIDGIPVKNYYCEAYKKFFEYSLPRMQTIARDVRFN